jgi:putative ABC transport system permease protein
MGFESPQTAIGQQISYWGEVYTLVGVLKDYHQQSPKMAFEPHIYRYVPHGRGRLGQFAIKINIQNASEVIEIVREQYEQLFPGNPFNFFFLDDYYNQQYQEDIKFGRVVGIFSIFAVIVTSLGILGLAAFVSSQRTKEIGVRKVLGAGIGQILILLTIDFVKLLLLAYLIAIPIVFWIIEQWLETFAYRFDIDTLLFVLPLLLVSLITVLTIASHVIRAALANPVEALRYE